MTSAFRFVLGKMKTMVGRVHHLDMSRPVVHLVHQTSTRCKFLSNVFVLVFLSSKATASERCFATGVATQRGRRLERLVCGPESVGSLSQTAVAFSSLFHRLYPIVIAGSTTLVTKILKSQHCVVTETKGFNYWTLLHTQEWLALERQCPPAYTDVAARRYNNTPWNEGGHCRPCDLSWPAFAGGHFDRHTAQKCMKMIDQEQASGSSVFDCSL